MPKLQEDDVFVCKKEYVHPYNPEQGRIKIGERCKIFLLHWEVEENNITQIFIKKFSNMPCFVNGPKNGEKIRNNFWNYFVSEKELLNKKIKKVKNA